MFIKKITWSIISRASSSFIYAGDKIYKNNNRLLFDTFITKKVNCIHCTTKMSTEVVDPSHIDKFYQEAIDLVHKAGCLICLRNEKRRNYVEKESDIDLVTETDQDVEKLLIGGLSEKFPTHKFIGEETSAEDGKPPELTNEPTWIIDPVDGTMNFVHSFPHSCISIGLLCNKITQIGIVYNPLLKQLFTARLGHGAYYNGRRISVSKITNLSKALITTEFGTSRDPEKEKIVQHNMRKIVGAAHGVRVLGSAALNMCMVAMGAADANFEFGLHAWDMCAGDIIVREAGGVCLDPGDGGPLDIMSRRSLCAATPELAEQIIKLLVQYYPKPRDDGQEHKNVKPCPVDLI